MIKSRKTLAALSLLIFSLILFYLWNHRSDLNQLSLKNLGWVGLCTLAVTGSLLLNALFVALIVNHLQGKLSLSESFHLAVASSTLNLFLPMHGGGIAKAIYLKNRCGFAFSSFVILTGCNYVFRIGFSGLVALSLMVWLTEESSKMLFITGALLSLGVVTLLRAARRIGKNRLPLAQSWALLAESPKLIFAIAVWNALDLVCQLLMYWFGYRAIGNVLTLKQIALVGSVGNLSTVGNLIPGALGICEAAVATAGSVLSLSAPQSVLAVLVTRVATILLLAVTAPFSVPMLLKETRERN